MRAAAVGPKTYALPLTGVWNRGIGLQSTSTGGGGQGRVLPRRSRAVLWSLPLPCLDKRRSGCVLGRP